LPVAASDRANKNLQHVCRIPGWLENNHDRVTELWLGFYNKRTNKQCLTYREALDEALCFGWIEGVRKSIDETSYKQRFSFEALYSPIKSFF
jgi:uncharacterized protein YdeI (YjbR/CyaY-like superfamily)